MAFYHHHLGLLHSLESLHGVMVSTLARNARDVGSRPALDIVFPIFIKCTTIVLNKYSTIKKITKEKH